MSPRKGLRPLNVLAYPPLRHILRSYRTFHPNLDHSKSSTPEEIETMLSTPTWSVRSLLPSSSTETTTDIQPQQLHHLLRLSALPLPKNPEQEATMLSDLRAQLHFVKQIQRVDTSGVEPLTSIRDESADAQRERVIGLEVMREALGKESVIGKFHKRIRRQRKGESGEGDEKTRSAEQWSVLQSAERKVGNFFVVDGEDFGKSQV